MKPQSLISSVTILFVCFCLSPSVFGQNYKLVDDNTFLITELSTDKTYGTEKNPIKVGGDENSGPSNERRFLNALAGPNGEKISYTRKGSCCHFETPNGFMGGGLLDMYEITWPGQKKPVMLYINMYDPGELKCPVGFTLRGK